MDKFLRADLRSGLRKFDRKRKKQVLAAPNAIIEQQAARIANYELAKSEVSQWDSTVKKNRIADHLVFPEPPTHRVTMPESNEERKIRGDVFKQKAIKSAKQGSNELDARIYGTLYPGETGDKFVEKTSAALKDSDDEFDPTDKRSLQDRLAVRRVIKVKQGQLTAKLRQRAKIRSKNYHRHLKRQRVAEEAKQLSELATTDPEAFKEKLERIEKMRIEERMTQRHRQGGKWARQMKAFQKMSKGGTEGVNEMQEKARMLLQKHRAEEEEDDEDDEEGMRVDDDGWTTVLRKPAPRSSLPAGRSLHTLTDIHNVEMDEEDDLEMGTRRRRTLAEVEELGNDVSSQDAVAALSNAGASLEVKPAPSQARNVIINLVSTDAQGVAAGLDPSVMDPVSEMETQLEQLVGEVEDLEEEFAGEKADIKKEEQPRDVNGFLPGWNTWTGPGTEVSKSLQRKQDKFSIKAPVLSRRDEGNRRLVIRERPTSKAYRRHQVREIPFPFETAEEWEASKKPIGRLWNTEATHRDLIRPRVAVKMGQIIKPMSRDVLYQRAEKREKRKKKNEGRRGKGGKMNSKEGLSRKKG